MKAKSAERYAQALIDLAIEANVQHKVQKDLDALEKLLRTSQDLERVLFHRIFSMEEKKSVIESVLAKASIQEITGVFLNFLVVRNRFAIFYDLKEVFDEKLSELEKKSSVEVSSARELSADYKKKLLEKFEERLGKKCDI